MGHTVQLVVGREASIVGFLQDWPGSRAVDLRGGWRAIPVDESLYDAIAARFAAAPMVDALDHAPRGIANALANATARGGGLAYVETDYFGGAGEQSALAYVDGVEACAPARSRGAGGPINAALRVIGVIRDATDDEFDTIGLGLRRSMDDYQPEGLVRLRRGPAGSGAGTTDPAAPVWLVMLVLAACLALGIAMAMMR